MRSSTYQHEGILSRHLESRDPVGGQEEAGGLLPICHPDPGEGGAEEVLGFLGEHRLSGPDCAVYYPTGLLFFYQVRLEKIARVS